MVKRSFAMILAACILAALLPAASAAGSTVVYDGASIPFYQRSKQQIADQYNNAIRKGNGYSDKNSESWYTRQPQLEAPYDEGAVRQSTLLTMSAMTDFWRWLSGVPLLKHDAGGSVGLQKGALIRNWDFNHVVSDEKKPADMPHELWEAGKVSHNVLAYGFTPLGSIFGWCNEGYNKSSGTWDTVGHRFCLLSTDVSELSFGFSGKVSIGVMAERANKPALPFAAFPAPGLEPTELYSAQICAWSIEPDPSLLRVPDQTMLRVTVTDSAGRSYVCTQANGKLKYATCINDINFVQPDAEGENYPDGSEFTVLVTGLQDVATGNPAELRYQVQFFSMLNYMETTVSGCTPAGLNRLTIPSSLSDPASLQMLAALLPETVVVSTESGRTLELPILGAWEPDAEKQCFTATVDASGLPQTVTDPAGCLRSVAIEYKVMDYTGRLMLTGGTDAPATFALRRYMLGTPNVALYQFRPAESGWTAIERYNQDSTGFSDDSTTATFVTQAFAPSDAGTWFGVYSNSWVGGWVVGPVQVRAACEHPETWNRTLEPTCTEPGVAEVYCAVCGELLMSTAITPRGHDWMEPSYVWSWNNSTVTASRSCRNDETHVQTETAYAVSEVTKQPTEEEEGEQVFTAQFSNEAFQKQTRTVTLPKLQPGGEPTLPCDGGAGCPGSVFKDMPPKGNWAHDAIDWAIVNEITTGTSATSFTPGKNCTRAQVVTFLWRACGCPTPRTQNNPFVDVKSDAFYYDPVLWASESGVTSGTSADRFSPNRVCTRGQVVTFLWRACGSPAPRTQNNPFADVKRGAFYYDAVLWASESDVTSGTSATAFSPGKNCTRAQVVTFLWRSRRTP